MVVCVVGMLNRGTRIIVGFEYMKNIGIGRGNVVCVSFIINWMGFEIDVYAF